MKQTAQILIFALSAFLLSVMPCLPHHHHDKEIDEVCIATDEAERHPDSKSDGDYACILDIHVFKTDVDLRVDSQHWGQIPYSAINPDDILSCRPDTEYQILRAAPAEPFRPVPLVAPSSLRAPPVA